MAFIEIAVLAHKVTQALGYSYAGPFVNSAAGMEFCEKWNLANSSSEFAFLSQTMLEPEAYKYEMGEAEE